MAAVCVITIYPLWAEIFSLWVSRWAQLVTIWCLHVPGVYRPLCWDVFVESYPAALSSQKREQAMNALFQMNSVKFVLRNSSLLWITGFWAEQEQSKITCGECPLGVPHCLPGRAAVRQRRERCLVLSWVSKCLLTAPGSGQGEKYPHQAELRCCGFV